MPAPNPTITIMILTTIRGIRAHIHVFVISNNKSINKVTYHAIDDFHIFPSTEVDSFLSTSVLSFGDSFLTMKNQIIMPATARVPHDKRDNSHPTRRLSAKCTYSLCSCLFIRS